MRRSLVALIAVALLLPAAPAAMGHAERDATFPGGELGVPEYRAMGPTIVVCKADSTERIAALPAPLRVRNQGLLDDGCDFEHIQAAVDAVQEQGTRILVLPGIYREEPSVALYRAYEEGTSSDQTCNELAARAPEASDGGFVGAPGGTTEGDDERGTPVYSYEEQRSCPHVQNLIGVFGDTDDDGVCDNALCDLQIEGTGARPEDVIIDGNYDLLNGIRGDRADGIYLRNLTVQRFEFNAVYVMETDGFVMDDVLTRWNDEYGFLTFAVDNGLYENCEGWGNGDSAIYPGSASDLNGDRTAGADSLIPNIPDIRFATEIRACRGHHATLGYSGTAGNSVWTHHSEWDHNATGMAMDSLFPDHPGLPQDHALVEDNLFHSNNVNYYARYVHTGACEGDFGSRGYDDGVVCPVVPLPVGTGALIAGGNYNLFRNNRFYDNWRQGHWQFFIPATFRGEDDPSKQFDTSNWNTYTANLMGANPRGFAQPNGFDFVWDGEGEGNCWASDNTSASGEVTYAVDDDVQVPFLPPCDQRPPFTPGPAVAVNAECAEYNRDTNPDPGSCDWFEDPEIPIGRQPENPTLQRLDGVERVATSILASQEGFPSGAAVAVLARADLYPDALAGAPLAAAVGGPVLLTYGDRLHDDVRAEMTRLGVTRVVLLGQTEALSDQIQQDVLSMGITDVVRIGGPDRFATAVEIAEVVGGAHAFLAKGVDADPARAWADALAASSVAALLERPILLTAPDVLPPVTRDHLESGDITDVKIVGGPAAIQGTVEEAVRGLLNDVERLAGETRLETSVALAEYAEATKADPTEVWLATAWNWPDGIAAGASVAVDEGVLLLVDDLGDGSPARAWLDRYDQTLENVRILGGIAAVDEGVAAKLRSGYFAEDGDAVGDRSSGTRRTVGTFRALPGAPAEYQDVTGYAVMERRLDGTTRTRVYVQGLPTPMGTMHPTHAHSEACSFEPTADNPHYMVDVDGPVMEPNEIHPMFMTDEFGVGVGDSTVFHIAGQDVPSGMDAVSVMIHAPMDQGAAKVLCADLE